MTHYTLLWCAAAPRCIVGKAALLEIMNGLQIALDLASET